MKVLLCEPGSLRHPRRLAVANGSRPLIGKDRGSSAAKHWGELLMESRRWTVAGAAPGDSATPVFDGHRAVLAVSDPAVV